MKVVIYTRVSKGIQSVEMQLSDLREFAKRRNFEVYKEYCDIGVSGAKDDRKQLKELMDDVRKKKVDAVLVWKFDRFARSTRHLINTLFELNQLGVAFISYTENIDTSSPAGKVVFAIISAIAEFERDLIRERVLAGLENAKRKGKKLGRRPIVPVEHKKIIDAHKVEPNLSIRKLAKKIKMSASTVFKTLSLFKKGKIDEDGFYVE